MAEFWQWKGDLPTGSGYVMLKDGAGRQGLNTVFGDSIQATRITDIAVQFQYNIASEDVTITTVDTGTITQSNHQAVAATGNGVSGSAIAESVDKLRYIPGHEGYAMFTTEFTSPVIGSNQLIGIFDNDDGFFIGFIDTTFCIVRRKDGVDTIVNQSDFNLDKLDGSGAEGLNVDFTFGNVWRITYGWLGHATITFEVMEKDGTWTSFHKILFPNSTNGTSIGNPVLPMRIEVTKTSGTANITLKTGSWNAGVIGEANINSCSNRYKSFAATATITATNSLTNIFTLKNISAFQTFKNKVRTKLIFLSAACDGNKLTSIRLIKNATLGVTASYTYIDSGNSTIQYDTTATTVSSGTTLLTLQLGKTDSRSLDIENLFITMLPTETLTFAAISSLATDVSISTRWAEEF